MTTFLDFIKSGTYGHINMVKLNINKNIFLRIMINYICVLCSLYFLNKKICLKHPYDAYAPANVRFMLPRLVLFFFFPPFSIYFMMKLFTLSLWREAPVVLANLSQLYLLQVLKYLRRVHRARTH